MGQEFDEPALRIADVPRISVVVEKALEEGKGDREAGCFSGQNLFSGEFRQLSPDLGPTSFTKFHSADEWTPDTLHIARPLLLPDTPAHTRDIIHVHR